MSDFKQTRRAWKHQTVEGFLATPEQPSQEYAAESVGRSAGVAGGIDAIAQPHSDEVEREQATAAAGVPADELEQYVSTVKIDLGLPGEPAEWHQKHPLVWRKRWSSLRRWSFRTAMVMLAVTIGLGGFLFAEGYMKIHKVFNGGASAAALQADVNPSLLKGEGDGRVNILLLGIGGPNHDGSDLTDTILLASIDPVNKTATLLSVPRDLWVKMPNNFMSNYQKINAAYESGKYAYLGKIDASNSNRKAIEAGFQAVDQTVSQVLGVPIHYNVLVNFQAFQQAVDTVGGVTVNVPEALVDPTMAWENNWNPVLAKAGLQTFNGKQALLYVRSRETSSDFARTERQRAVMLALKDKIMTLGTLSNPIKISNLMSAFGDNVVTDFSLPDAVRLYDIMKGIDNSKVKSIGLADPPNNYVTTGNVNGISIVKPRAGLFDYSEIQTYVRSQLKDGYIVKENARIELLNGTGDPALADNEAALLKSYGYNIVTVDDAPTPTYDQTVLVDLTHGKDKYTKHYLEQRFSVKAVSQPPDSAIATDGADFVIILGNDETTSSQS